MNLFKALEAASIRLTTNDPEFHSQANLTTDILRSAGVYPHRRSSLNGHVHKLLSAAIVHVYQQDTSLDVTTRRAGTFALYGYSTKLPSYLTKAVELGFLTSQNNRATGRLQLYQYLILLRRPLIDCNPSSLLPPISVRFPSQSNSYNFHRTMWSRRIPST